MKLITTAFEKEKSIPSKYTCDGENVSPTLKIAEVPKKAKSLALIMDDPDSPTGTWTHWTVWNIKPDTMDIQEGALPFGAVEGKTSFGDVGYGGPCPGSGTHRYFFKLYALDSELDVPAEADIKSLETAMEGKVLASAEYMGTYKRKQ